MLRQHLTYANVGTTIALVLGASGFAVAAAPNPTTKVVRACVAKRTGVVRVRAAGARCRRTERPLSWNRVGPRGVSGVFTGYSKAESDAKYLDKAGKAVDADKLDGQDASAFVPAVRLASAGGRVTTAGEESTPAAPACAMGTMLPTAGTAAPPGWSFAHGQTVQIAEHPALFSVLGTRYGGDGKTTFALPDAYDLGPGGTNWLICTGGTV
jgi:hypothetical protein